MASSFPQFHSDYTYTTDFCNFPAPLVAGGNNGGAMWAGQENFHLFDDEAFDIKPSPESDFVPSLSMVSSYPEPLGVSDMAVPTLPELGGFARVRNFVGGCRPEYLCGFGVECSRFVTDFKPDFPNSVVDNLGTQAKPMQAIEGSNVKVGRYSVEERKNRILRYLRKRNRRNFNKTIKYECRKTLADRRVRVRGRFARNNELCEEELMMKNSNIPQESKGLYYDDAVLNQSDDDWLQEAMESLVYLPYISGSKYDGANV